MSHLITAHNEHDERIAALEMGMSGPRRLSKTGFDLYGAYKAWHLNAGPSGAGEGLEVDIDTAWSAYEKALAWAKSVFRGGAGSTTGKYCLTRADQVIDFTLAVFRAAEKQKVFLRFS